MYKQAYLIISVTCNFDIKRSYVDYAELDEDTHLTESIQADQNESHTSEATQKPIFPDNSSNVSQSTSSVELKSISEMLSNDENITTTSELQSESVGPQRGRTVTRCNVVQSRTKRVSFMDICYVNYNY